MIVTPLLQLAADQQASDLFFSAGAPVNIKIGGYAVPVNAQILDADTVKRIAYEMMAPRRITEFESRLELSFAFRAENIGNFRVSVFRQRGDVAMVIRYLKGRVDSIEDLNLPAVLKELIMEKHGLVLVVGATGSGKSTTLASMIDHRNSTTSGHILTIEDPIEYVFRHGKSIVNQREIGTDTLGFESALSNGMREAPDVLMIGEVRDRDTMKQALIFSETGHLCLTTLHANNSYHALNRIVNFFPYESRQGVLSDLSMSLRAVISQRLVRGVKGKLVPAVEILLNTALIADLIKSDKLDEIREAIEKSVSTGSQTFEQALYKLYKNGQITREEAMRNADSASNLAALIDFSARTGAAKTTEVRREQAAPQDPVSVPPADFSSADFKDISLDLEEDK